MILKRLLNGVRLSQPPMTTLLVYNVLIRCWLADPDARPSFNDLKNTFSKFALDPKKYLLLKVSFSSVILRMIT
jgi:hypothetical protein